MEKTVVKGAVQRWPPVGGSPLEGVVPVPSTGIVPSFVALFDGGSSPMSPEPVALRRPASPLKARSMSTCTLAVGSPPRSGNFSQPAGTPPHAVGQPWPMPSDPKSQTLAPPAIAGALPAGAAAQKSQAAPHAAAPLYSLTPLSSGGFIYNYPGIPSPFPSAQTTQLPDNIFAFAPVFPDGEGPRFIIPTRFNLPYVDKYDVNSSSSSEVSTPMSTPLSTPRSMSPPATPPTPFLDPDPQVTFQSIAARKQKLERYRQKRVKRNYNREVDQTRSQRAATKPRDENGHFVNDGGATKAEREAMIYNLNEMKQQLLACQEEKKTLSDRTNRLEHELRLCRQAHDAMRQAKEDAERQLAEQHMAQRQLTAANSELHAQLAELRSRTEGYRRLVEDPFPALVVEGGQDSGLCSNPTDFPSSTDFPELADFDVSAVLADPTFQWPLFHD
eukprot:TRINITY_DN7997_c0_g1_i2.p1 TRINITY_DN7997_c0_g1~~TRINITY_DN7997_c0_g1_i2.p1  ORF type:complete len:444 (+),score=84.45 TRINITY_DN7997_c0_g1_i2:217-1548(+)